MQSDDIWAEVEDNGNQSDLSLISKKKPDDLDTTSEDQLDSNLVGPSQADAPAVPDDDMWAAAEGVGTELDLPTLANQHLTGSQLAEQESSNPSTDLANGWETDMESSIQKIGKSRLEDDIEPPITSSEIIAQALSRLRIIEEDRDTLTEQSVQLQLQVDRERKARHAAQESLSHAVQASQTCRESGEEQARRDASALEALRVQEAAIRAEVEAAERAPAASRAEDVLSSLRQRAEETEAAAARRQAALRRTQEELVTRLAVTLKVLQLQKAQAASQEARRERVRVAQADALRRVAAARAEEVHRAEARRALARRAEALLDSAALRAREVAAAQGAAEALARRLRADAELLRRAEEAVSLDHATADRERRVHDFLLREHAADSAAAAAGPGPGLDAGPVLVDAGPGLRDEAAAAGWPGPRAW
jgi:hypothetical protein